MHRQYERAALFLSYFTVLYNVLEGVVSIVVALSAGSTALLGFGVDSFVESLSGGIMIWRFRGSEKLCHDEVERREAMAIRLVGIALLSLAAYVIFESATKLYFAQMPERSLFGMLIALVSLVVMPVLFLFKRRIAHQIQSRSLVADSKQTLGCILLSIALFVGLGLNYVLGWWQADPIAGLVIAVFLSKEGLRAFKEQELCCS